jgi:phosphohistidine swiveling domain-containing protein
LQCIYAADGPVQRVYQRKKINYRPRDFLRVVGNELYVDRDEEMRTLLPSFGYATKTLRPRWSRLAGLTTTLGNLIALARVRGDEHALLEQVIAELGYVLDDQVALDQGVQDFMRVYELIFEINLGAEKKLHILKTALRREPIEVADVLCLKVDSDIDRDRFNALAPKGALGNSLDVADVLPFYASLTQSVGQRSVPALAWWSKLAYLKQAYFSPLIQRAQTFTLLRELGRWLTVKHVNRLRYILSTLAVTLGCERGEDAYFFTIEELLAGHKGTDLARTRREQFEQCRCFTLPVRLVSCWNSLHATAGGALLGVARGHARGTLVDEQHLDTSNDQQILFVTTLSPDLTRYFDRVQGIAAEKGGLLSHLAIIARERSLPVVVNVDLSTLGLKLGDKVELDASAGKLCKIES